MTPFHAHLETCTQCRANPHALCREGAKLLLDAAANVEVEIQEALRDWREMGR